MKQSTKRHYTIQLSREKDADVIEKLEETRHKSDYIINLVIEDMMAQRVTKVEKTQENVENLD